MTHINQRRDDAATWAQFNPILQKGEMGWESDTFRAKMGDGAKTWNALPYAIDVSGKAPLVSPVFTGDPKAPTPAPGDNDTSIATTAFVQATLGGKVDKYTNIDNADLNALTTSGNYRGNTLTNAPSGQTGGFVGVSGNGAAYAIQTFSVYGGTRAWQRTNNNGTWSAWMEMAGLASPTFTGDPKAPTPATSDNDTSIATTAFVKAALLAAHPVGDIKMTTANVNPGTYLGGTWVAWGSGRVPVGVDTTDSDFNAVEKTGGSKTHNHGLTAAGAAIYTGGGVYRKAAPAAAGGFTSDYVWTATAGANAASSTGIGSAGGAALIGSTDSGSSVSPYITCYMWKRTA